MKSTCTVSTDIHGLSSLQNGFFKDKSSNTETFNAGKRTILALLNEREHITLSTAEFVII